MDYLQSFVVSAAGMRVERTRVEVAAMNLANANTVAAPGDRPYQAMRVLARPGASFAALVGDPEAGGALPAVSIEPASTPPRLVYEPGHPLADARGFVAHPGVDPATEMVTLMSALRSYEANVAAMSTARVLALKTLEIGRSG